MQITTIGLDLAKHWFQVHGVDADGQVVVRRRLWRSGVIAYFRSLEPCLVGMEACATAHHWARELTALGHMVKLMPPAYVKAYFKRNKNDATDAEAICEAVTRPSMRFVPVKDGEQQSVLMLPTDPTLPMPPGQAHLDYPDTGHRAIQLVHNRLQDRACEPVRPKRSLPPLEFCRGVIPSQAANSRPDRNREGSATVAAIALAPLDLAETRGEPIGTGLKSGRKERREPTVIDRMRPRKSGERPET
jgi:Transposase